MASPDERTPWPAASGPQSGRPRVGVVVANSNTRLLIARLVFSLYRILGRSEFAEIVVVDNASGDGSRELLAALDDARLIHLIANRAQRYHGPALTEGISWLARRQETADASDRIDYVWVLDSDVIVLRRDTVRDALRAFAESEASVLGQAMGDPADDALLAHNPEMLDPCSLILDPARVWRPPIPPFLEDGVPSEALQLGADGQGLSLVAFPFVEDGYLLHLGRGSLRQVMERMDTANRYYDWAVGHHEPHFGGREDGPELLAAFTAVFEAEVGCLTAERLVAACLRPAVLSPDGPHHRARQRE